MNKKKLIVFGVIFAIALFLILIGFLLEKKDKNNLKVVPYDSSKDTLVKEKEKVKVEPLETLTAEELQKELKKYYDTQTIPSNNGNSGSGQNENNETEQLQHKSLNYQISIPKKDLEHLLVEETEKDGIISTAFYYQGKDVKALVFSINNYPIYEWEKWKDAVNDKVLGKTPVRVMTYTLASDNPFPPSSDDYKKYMYYVSKVNEYIKTFQFIQKETQ